MQRIDVLTELSQLVTEEDLFISSLGALRNDWWNLRPGGQDNTFFLSGMGTVAPMALGLALGLPHRRIVALDTDGSVLMNASGLATLADQLPPNLTVIVFDNSIYESIGGVPTLTSRRTDLAKMADGAGCINCVTANETVDFAREAHRLLVDDEFGFLVAKIQPGIHSWAPEKQKLTDGVEDKYRFIRHVEALEGIRIHHGAPGPFA
ncbi:MAG: sulfopyruvate decarboxylase subunit beta [Solirubrobacterales bacterium]|nr:sulfopyruvate decarboxylase subunit beta [Solirubrobacterales bacterium]